MRIILLILLFLIGMAYPGTWQASAKESPDVLASQAQNRLALRETQDARLRDAVMEALSAEPSFREQGIWAEVRERVIHLKGNVSSMAAKNLAEQIAENYGARKVINEISVDSHLYYRSGISG